MQYLGGKSKIAKKITAAILANTDRRSLLIEPFCGGGAMTAALAPHFDRVEASDIVEDLILMWQAVQRGWVPPTTITEAEYKSLKHEPPSALRGFVGFGCSFGGKWFGGYARNAEGTMYSDWSSRSLRSVVALRAEIVYQRAPFSGVSVPPESVVYADPPYAGTTEYQNIFNNDAFWRIADDWATNGADVFVSEYRAPPDWPCVWEKELARGLRNADGSTAFAIERLYFKPGRRGGLSASLARLSDAVERLTAALA